MGVEVMEVRAGYSRLSMRVREDMINGHRLCHGGLIFALADTAFAYACNTHNNRSVAMSCSIDFLHPAHAAENLIATAEESWRGGRTGIYDVQVHTESGELIAIFRGKSFATGEPVL